jgi:hypothetical protein
VKVCQRLPKRSMPVFPLYFLQGRRCLQEAEALNKDGDRKGAANFMKVALQSCRVAVEPAPKAHSAIHD